MQLEIPLKTLVENWENSLEGPQTNHASFYGPEKVKRPFVAYFLFSFSCMALPLDPLGQSVRHGIYWTELPLPLPHTPPTPSPPSYPVSPSSSPVASRRRAEEQLPRRRHAEGLSPGGGARRGPPQGRGGGLPRGTRGGGPPPGLRTRRRRQGARAHNASRRPRASRHRCAGAARRGSRTQELGGSLFGKVNLLYS